MEGKMRMGKKGGRGKVFNKKQKKRKKRESMGRGVKILNIHPCLNYNCAYKANGQCLGPTSLKSPFIYHI